ncbi:restriction endonuclease subunit S [Aeromonas sp. QDB11]|uniref:restriction endonuclease subunit S n=1 Tax=Aeromonas sp. QDB11 TaxID=2990482 RepID=UPI0022E2661D|nr:restriction endonuclease subunit S [Aeromonas sp. QDB11]
MAEQMMQEAVGKAIPVGYKQTEVGVIPEDWGCLDLSELFYFKQGVQVPVEKQSKTRLDGFVRFIRIIDLTNQNEPPRYIKNIRKTECLTCNDLFMVRYGAPGLVGFNKEGLIANNLFRLLPKVDVHESFYFYYLGFRHSDILDVSGSSTMPAINFSTISKFKVVKPSSVKEQTAIANVLSDSDALIDALEQLIAKKQAIKTAAMQQLLTGRTRLPQFALRPDGNPKGYKSSELGQIPEDWDINSINTVGSIITGSTPPTAVACYWEGDIPWVTPTDIGDAKNIFKSERRITEKGLQTIRGLPVNSVLVTCIASIGKNAILKNAGACNQQINAIVPRALFDVDFLYYNMEFSKERLRQCAGITATPIISKALFSDFLLSHPLI